MGSPQQQLDSDRLFEAVEACVSTAMEFSSTQGGPSPYPADLLDSPQPPAQLRGFQKWEVQQACEFLIRMGIFYRSDAYRKG